MNLDMLLFLFHGFSKEKCNLRWPKYQIAYHLPSTLAALDFSNSDQTLPLRKVVNGKVPPFAAINQGAFRI